MKPTLRLGLAGFQSLLLGLVLLGSVFIPRMNVYSLLGFLIAPSPFEGSLYWVAFIIFAVRLQNHVELTVRQRCSPMSKGLSLSCGVLSR